MKVGDYVISDGLKYGKTLFKSLDITKHELGDIFYLVYRIAKIGSRYIYFERVHNSINSWSAGNEMREEICHNFSYDKQRFEEFYIKYGIFFVIDCDSFK